MKTKIINCAKWAGAWFAAGMIGFAGAFLLNFLWLSSLAAAFSAYKHWIA